MLCHLLRPGGHAIIFCTAQQFPEWETLFNQHMTELDSDGTLPKKRRKTFSVDKVPIVMAKHPSGRNGFPGRCSCTLRCDVEFVLHLKKNGLSFQEESKMVNYENFNYVSSTFPAFSNIMDNVKGLLSGEQVRIKIPENPRTCALRSEQKPVALLKELICRFSQPGDLVVDPFAGTFSTAFACMDLPNHRKFVSCEKDETCFSYAFTRILRHVSSLIVKVRTDIPLNSVAVTISKLIEDKYGEPRKICDWKWCAPKGQVDSYPG